MASWLREHHAADACQTGPPSQEAPTILLSGSGRARSGPEVGAVVGPDILAVGFLAFPLGVIVGGLTDLVLGQVDVDLAALVVDPVDDPGRQHALFAEDPEAGVDHDVASADVVGGGVEVADGAVGGDDLEADQVSGLRLGGVSIAPEVSHRVHLPRLPTAATRFQTTYSCLSGAGRNAEMAGWTWCDMCR